jgi:capsular exopolysaccharide synthesis family protein
LFSHDEQSPQVILLTSAHPGEGKTVTTLNLAITLAQSGRKVVVVDADVRRGRCHTLLHKENHPGLTAVLAGNVPLQQALQETTIPGLSFLSRGVAVPTSPFSLGSPKMKELVAALRTYFEFVLIDSPPAITVSDAVLLARLCDGVLLVIHGQQTTEESARRLVNELEAVHAQILGVVLNGVDFNGPDYADYRRYAESIDVTMPAETKARARDATVERSTQS